MLTVTTLWGLKDAKMPAEELNSAPRTGKTEANQDQYLSAGISKDLTPSRNWSLFWALSRLTSPACPYDRKRLLPTPNRD